MKFQFLVEIDLKTLCHGRDENCDAEVLNDREARRYLREFVREAVETWGGQRRLTDLCFPQNIRRVKVKDAPDYLDP